MGVSLHLKTIDLVTVFDAILMSRKLQCLYENLMSNNFRRTAVLKKISIVIKTSLLRILLKKLRVLHWLEDLEPLFKIVYTIVCKKVSGKIQTSIWKI